MKTNGSSIRRFADSPAEGRIVTREGRNALTGHGRIHGMTITMDAAGRIVIPSEIRREAGLQPDTPLDVRWRDGVIEIEPRPLPVRLERKGRLLVAKPAVRVERLRASAVEGTRRRLNER